MARADRVELPGLTRRSGRAVGVTASILFHLAVLTALGLGAHGAFRMRATDAFPVQLVRPSAVWLRPRPPPPSPARRLLAIRPHRPRLLPPPDSPAPYAVPVIPPQPAPAAAAATPASAAPRAPLLLGLGEAMQKVLGCNDEARAGMTAAQRAACDKRIGEDVPATRRLPLMIPPDKKAAWDREMWKRHKPMGDPMVTCTGPGSNFGFSCIPDKQRQPPPDGD